MQYRISPKGGSMVLFPGNSTQCRQHLNKFDSRSLRVYFARSVSSVAKQIRNLGRLCAIASLVCVSGSLFSISAIAQTAAQRGQTLFATSGAGSGNCTSSGCHLNGAEVNGANSTAVINNAIALFMGGLGPGGAALTPAQTSDIAAYLATIITDPFVAPANATYNTPLDIVIPTAGGSVVKFASAYSNFDHFLAANGSKGTAAYLSGSTIRYSPSANQCGADTFTYVARNAANTLSSSTRSVSVFINSPSPTTSLPAQNIPYSISPTPLTGLASGGSASGLGVTAQPSVGTVSASGLSLNYTASASSYAPSVTFTYVATGPCSTQSAPVTVTINLTTLPPAPTVTVPAGPFQTAFNTAAAPINLTSNISGVSTSITVVGATNGTTLVSGNSVTFTPTAGFTGTGSFTYRANGPGGSSATSGPVNITVLPAPPTVTAAPGPFTTAFNTPIAIDLATRITGTFTNIATTGVSNGTTMVSGTVVTFTPTAGFFGTGSFQFTATNAGGTSAPSAAMNITVLPPPPSVAPRSVLVTYQLPLPIDLTGQITGVSTSVAVITPAANGTTTVLGNVVTYTPNALFTGPDSFTYQATGPGGPSGVATVSITVVAPAPPTATSPPPVTTAFNTQAAIDVTAQLSGVFTSVAVVTAPANGTIVSIVGNVITYRPNTGYAGADSFTYRALGPGGTLSTPPALVSISVLPAVPIVSAPTTVTTAFNTPVPINLAAQISGTFTSIAISTPPANGSAALVGTTVTYTPGVGFSGGDSFRYTANGPGGTSLPSPPVNITVLPAAPSVAARAVAVGFATQTAIDLTAQISGAVTSIAVVTLPASGSIVSVVGNVVTYLPNTGFAGTDTFTYRATGPGGTSAVATVTITVTSAPPPIATGATALVTFNTPKAIDLTAQISGFFSSIAVATPPANGTIVSVVGNVVTYSPKAGYVGNDSFTFTATGPGGTSAPATLSLTVAAPPAPTAADRAVSVLFNTVATINLAAQISGVVTSITVVTAPLHGTISLAGNVVSYTPTAGYFGDDSFTYTATGPGGVSSPATVSITVGTLAPTAGAFKMIVPLNTSTTMDLAPFITGSGVSGIVVTAGPRHGTARVNGTKLTFTPATDYFGSDNFSYAVFGNAGTSPSAVVTVTIVGRPDPTKDATVTGLVAAQTDAAKRFSRAQISNFQSRMESLHRAEIGATAPVSGRGSDEARPSVATGVQPALSANGRIESKKTANDNTYRDSSYAMAPVMPDAATKGQKPVPFLSDAVSLLTSGSINLASAAGTAMGNPTNGTASGPSVWLAGSANFGTRSATGSRSGLEFTTSGISMGVDRRFGDQLVLGAGVGFARDRTDIGSDGSHSRARAYSGVAYGSYQPSARTFIDGLIGIGSLDFTSQRVVTPIDDIARGDRKGRQVFGSLSGGVEYRDNGVLLSPYARLDYASDRLNQNTETGAGPYALTYFRQTTPSVLGALGIRAESVHTTAFGLATPRLRAEYRHDFQGERQTSIGYADSVGGRFGLTTGAVSRNTLVFGVGSDFIYRGGWTVGIDYQLEHSTSFSKDSSQGIKFTITKELDGRDSPYSLIAAAISPKKPIDIQVDAGFMFDSNVTRAKASGEKLSDRVYSVNASKSEIFQINDNMRAILTGSLGGEKFDNYYRLSRAMAGLQGEIVYRPSAEFDAPTFAVFVQSSAERYESALRNGYRYSLGASVQKPLTDRINLLGAISHNERFGRSSVFNNRFNAVRFNADYTLSTTETIYVTGEYRRGQIVSTGLPSLENIEVADVFVQDDAYPGGQFFSYRFDGRTVLSTLGYNLGLGPRHSLDLSWRRAQSTPNFRPAFATSPSSYVADQYSIVYLIRF